MSPANSSFISNSGGHVVTHMKASLAVDSHDENGEGPAWDAVGKRLLWSDNATGTVHEAKSDGAGAWRESKRWSLGRPIGAAIPRAKGGLIVVGGTEIFRVNEPGTVIEPGTVGEAGAVGEPDPVNQPGATTTFARLGADPDLVTLNDAKCDLQGRLWAGTYTKDLSTPHGALYRIDPDGTVTTMLTGVTISNGLDWSPDGSIMYFIDSMTRTVDAFDFDSSHGTISNRRTVLSVELGGPDGMAVDREGCLWVAVYGTSEVRRHAPDGALLARVEISTPAVTSCAFGGVDGGELFITSVARIPEPILPIIRFGAEVAERAAAARGAGGLFVCRPGVTGLPATPFAG
jgi:sugar lactone lactonase YvrE